MYEKEEFTYLSRDGRTQIRAIAWKPADQSVRAVLQIAHGMVENGMKNLQDILQNMVL